MYAEKNSFEIITVEKEILVVGLSHKKNGIPMPELWDHMDEIEAAANHTATPSKTYGLWIDPHPNEDYMIGIEVSSLSGQSSDFSAFTIPCGQYIQNTFNAESIGELLGEKIRHKFKELENWAKKNDLHINWDVAVEVYPDGLFEMEYPEMQYWCHVL